MDDFVAILKTEYSTAFDEHRKKAMINSFYKYGPAKKNYGEYKCMDAIKNLEIRLQKYKETGNTEYLVDVANFAMLELCILPFSERNTHQRVILLARLLDSESINWRCSFDIVNYTNAHSCCLWGGSILAE